MALDFPNSPTNGQTYTDPSTGEQWSYDSPTNSWTSEGLVNTTGGLQYKGSLDITAAPPTGLTSGWQYSSSTTGTPNAGFTDLTGTVNKGDVVLYTGTGWVLRSHSIPDATAAVKGVDTQKWSRTGTELSPTTAGDSVFTSGVVKVGGTTDAPNITLKADGTIGIGTSAPLSRLQINAASTARAYTSSVLDFSNAHLEGNWGGYTSSALTFSSGGGGGAAIEFSRGGYADTYISLWTNSTGGTNEATKRATLTNDGDFLLGGTLPASPNIRLSSGGNITYVGTLTPPSDVALKEAIVDADLDHQWDDIKRIQLRNYKWKDEPERGTMLGVIAQELETISPGLIVKDLDDDGNVVEGSCKVKVDALYMKMLGALQVAQQRIEALEAEVAALEGPQKKTNPGVK